MNELIINDGKRTFNIQVKTSGNKLFISSDGMEILQLIFEAGFKETDISVLGPAPDDCCCDGGLYIDWGNRKTEALRKYNDWD